jgi:hypothetical protein
VLAAVVFALVPWVTLGFGTPIAFIVAAIVFSCRRRAHAVALWISAGVYLAVIAGAAVAANIPGAPEVAGSQILVAMLGGGVQALFTIWFAASRETGPARYAVRRLRARARRSSDLPGPAHPGRAAVVLAILAAAGLIGGVLALQWADNFAAHHRVTVGRVTAVSSYTTSCGDSCDQTMYRATIRYRPAGSRPVTFVSDGFDNRPSLGARERVYYLPPPSRYASLEAPSGKQGNGIMLITAGLLVVVLLVLHLITVPRAGDRII